MYGLINFLDVEEELTPLDPEYCDRAAAEEQTIEDQWREIFMEV